MNRQTVTIGAVLLAVVVVAFGIAVYLEGGDSDDGSAAIAGPGRAAEARGIIADIEARRESESGQTAPRPAAALIERPAAAADQAAGGGAGAAVPSPAGATQTGAGAELDEAFGRAQELKAAGQLDDAQVLLFFGARRGHAPSAFAYAEMNDPNHHSPQTSLLPEPDAFQAYRWYSAAQDGGVEGAAARLDALREWAESAAAAGDTEAERLLLQWEQ
jgi:hypothetical protein